mgnify:FL=1
MAAASDVVRIAAAEIGVKESPSGSNCVKYNDWFYGRSVRGASYPWCAAFVSWVLEKAGAGHLAARSASCPAIMADAKRRGTYHAGFDGIAAGDLVLYQFDRDADPDHIGIVERVQRDAVIAIEGNTSVSSADNGGCVMRQLRARRLVMGYVRPNYGGANAHACGYSADSFIRDIQRAVGTAVDGIVGKNTRAALPVVSASRNAAHAVVPHLQTRLFALGYPVGAAGADGEFGADTAKALRAFQSSRGIEADAVAGPVTWGKLCSD